jgi:hypothetical protein
VGEGAAKVGEGVTAGQGGSHDHAFGVGEGARAEVGEGATAGHGGSRRRTRWGGASSARRKRSASVQFLDGPRGGAD